jgi:hypothetical protein
VSSDYAPSMDRLPEACPYSLSEIEDYLRNCHYHYVREEEPATFSAGGLCAERIDLERRYWLFEARDQAKQRQWFVVIGAGKTPYNPSSRMRRWIYGQTNDEDLSPQQFLDEVYEEHLAADARS